MNYLAFDTSSGAMTVLAKKGERLTVEHLDDCALQHSVLLMDEIDQTLKKADMTVADAEAIACVVGPGSFTGIRIGIATAKGFCLAAGKRSVPVTAFEIIAYTLNDDFVLAVVDAGRGYYYACGFDRDKNVCFDPAYLPQGQIERLREQYEIASLEKLPLATKIVRAEIGFPLAVERAIEQGRFAPLDALYLRKSQAEEQRKG